MSKKAIIVLDFDYISVVLAMLALIPIADMITSGGTVPLREAQFAPALALLPFWNIGYAFWKFSRRKVTKIEPTYKKVTYTKKRLSEESRIAILRLLSCGASTRSISKYFNISPVFVSKIHLTHPELVLQLSDEEQACIANIASTKSSDVARAHEVTTKDAAKSSVTILSSAYLFDKQKFIAAFGDVGVSAIEDGEFGLPKIARPNLSLVVNDSDRTADEVAREHFRPIAPVHNDVNQNATVIVDVTEDVESHVVETDRNDDRGVKLLSNAQLHLLLSRDRLDGLCLALVAKGMRRSDVARGASINKMYMSRLVSKYRKVDYLERVYSQIDSHNSVGGRHPAYSNEEADGFIELAKLFNIDAFDITSALNKNVPTQLVA